MNESLVLSFGYAGLFLVSFLAATLVPLSSEGAVALMAASGFDPAGVLLVATAGNSLGALANYLVGRYGGRFLLSKYIKADPAKLLKAEKACNRLGGPVLFFAWLPVVGDPLTLAAGLLKMNLAAFLFWVVLGKAARYWAIIGALIL